MPSIIIYPRETVPDSRVASDKEYGSGLTRSSFSSQNAVPFGRVLLGAGLSCMLSTRDLERFRDC